MEIKKNAVPLVSELRRIRVILVHVDDYEARLVEGESRVSDQHTRLYHFYERRLLLLLLAQAIFLSGPSHLLHYLVDLPF